jgi:hypothetical protein
MRTIALDEYYLTEQDETTVRRSANGLPAWMPTLEQPASTVPGATVPGPDRARRGMRRRLHVLRRAAGVALAA